MNLYDRSLSLRVRLSDANTDSIDHALLDRGHQVVALLDESSRVVRSVAEFRGAFELGPPPLDEKVLGQAARQFRTGLTKHQAAALQHQTTTKLEEAVRTQSRIATAWAKSSWKSRFERWEPGLARANAGGLFGDGARQRRIALYAAKLTALASSDPIAHRTQIADRLDTDIDRWRDAIDSLGAQLEAEIAALDQQRKEFDPAVQSILERAAADGVPLDEFTPELLALLKFAGVLGDLAVRRA
jgi:hypothetical protein